MIVKSQILLKIATFIMLGNISVAFASPPLPPPATGPAQAPDSVMQAQGEKGFVAVSVNDPKVQRAAAFAVKEMQEGSLVKVLDAKKEGVGDINYLLTIVLANKNGQHSQYQVEVCVPQKNIPWRLKTITPQNQSDVIISR